MLSLTRIIEHETGINVPKIKAVDDKGSSITIELGSLTFSQKYILYYLIDNCDVGRFDNEGILSLPSGFFEALFQ